MESVFVNQGGDEIELRPLTARQYLSARLEAESLGGETGNDEIARAVLLGAALLANGAYVDGERLFSTADEALDTMTAQEIIETAAYIDIMPETAQAAAETAKRVAAFIDTASEVGETAKRSAAPDGIEDARVKADFKEYVGGDDKRVEPEWREQAHTRRRYVKWDGGEAYSGADFTDRVSALSAAPVRDEMRRVSEFFQRDSRRYDGAISNY